MTRGHEKKFHFAKPCVCVMHRDQKRAWWWKLRASNGQIVAQSPRGYVLRGSARRAFRHASSVLQRQAAFGGIEVVDG